MSGRPFAEERLSSTARKLWREAARQEVISERALEAAAAARAELVALHEKTEARFGRSVRADAQLLDVLDLIEVEAEDRWVWRGVRNNKDLPTIRLGRSEKSLARYLAVEFGVITEDEFGMMYPRDGDTDDVNPFHRVLRESEAPTGYPDRYSFTVERDKS